MSEYFLEDQNIEIKYKSIFPQNHEKTYISIFPITKGELIQNIDKAIYEKGSYTGTGTTTLELTTNLIPILIIIDGSIVQERIIFGMFSYIENGLTNYSFGFQSIKYQYSEGKITISEIGNRKPFYYYNYYDNATNSSKSQWKYYTNNSWNTLYEHDYLIIGYK